MTVHQIASIVDEQKFQIECARTVLAQAKGYFEDKEERRTLPLYADTLDALLSVVDSILYEIYPKLEQSAEALIEHHKLLGTLR